MHEDSASRSAHANAPFASRAHKSLPCARKSIHSCAGGAAFVSLANDAFTTVGADPQLATHESISNAKKERTRTRRQHPNASTQNSYFACQARPRLFVLGTETASSLDSSRRRRKPHVQIHVHFSRRRHHNTRRFAHRSPGARTCRCFCSTIARCSPGLPLERLPELQAIAVAVIVGHGWLRMA